MSVLRRCASGRGLGGSPVVIVEVIVRVRVGADEVLEREVLPVRLAGVAVTEQVRIAGEGVSCNHDDNTRMTGTPGNTDVHAGMQKLMSGMG